MEERARIIRETAYVVLTKFDASFTKFVDASGLDCPTLVDMIVQHFSGFRDEAVYEGE